VVTDASAYNAISGGRCPSVLLAGGECGFTLTNKGAAAQTYTVTLAEDAGSKVLEYSFAGVTPVASGPMTTASEIAVGNAATLTAKLVDCPACSGETHFIYWDVEASHPDWLDSERTRYTMRITFE